MRSRVVTPQSSKKTTSTSTPWNGAVFARYGVFGVSTWLLGCDAPSLFSERFPLGQHAKWRCDTPPPRKGYLSDTCATPYENKANGCDTPLCDTISKGYCAIWGGISHWAANQSRFLGRGCDEALFSEKKRFSVKRGEAIQ